MLLGMQLLQCYQTASENNFGVILINMDCNYY